MAFRWDEGPSDQPLLRLGDFEFIRELGRGGIGVVYEARQCRLNRRVAVKMLLAGPWAPADDRRRFRAEAEAAARLRHPGIVTIHEVGDFEGQPYLAMELVAGPSLAELSRDQPLPARRAARLVRRVAEAIAHAHGGGVLHRDLKPSNVLVDEADQPRVTDFGLAKLLDAQLEKTRTGELAGSPNYLAPEQVRGAGADAQSDLYSIGAMLYQLLTARPPFMAETVAATLRQVVEAEPIPPRQLNAGVPPDLETLCLKCLRKEPRRRYGSVAELAADLARFEAGEPVLARRASLFERGISWCRRKPALALLTASLGLSLVVGLAGVLFQWRRAERSRSVMAENLYAADVAAACAALKDGNLGRARELLLRQAAPALQGTPEFTWNLLWSRCQGDELDLLGSHAWIVTCVAVSPDGQWAASGSQRPADTPSSSLKLWGLNASVSASTLERALATSNTIWSVAFTDDSRTLVSSGVEGVRFWDVETGWARLDLPELAGQEVAVAGDRVVASPNHPFFDASPSEPLRWLSLSTGETRTLGIRGRHPALSPDGRRLAVLDGGRNIQVYDLRDERLLATVATNHIVFRLRFSPDGTRLVAAGQMTSAKMWDLTNPGQTPLLFRSLRNVWDAALTPDGRTLVTATSQQQLELWDAADATHRGSLAGHDNEVWAVAATPDGGQLVSGGKDRTVRRWALSAKTKPPSAPQLRSARPVFSPDGSRLLTYARTNGSGRVSVVSPKTMADAEVGDSKKEPGFASSTPPLGFAPDASSLLFARERGVGVEWRRPGTGERVRQVDFVGATGDEDPGSAVLAGDGRSLALVDGSLGWGRWSTEDGRLLRRWNGTGLGEELRRAAVGRSSGGAGGRWRSRSASGTGRWLALAPLGVSYVVLVDFESGTATHLVGHRDDVAAAVFAWDDRTLATGSVDGTIRLWSVPEGRLIATLPGHMESVEAVAFSPDGRTLAAVNPGIEVTFWHVETRRELARLAHAEVGYHLAFSPDGRWLALSLTEGGLSTDSDRVELWGRR